jgi:hypothetical protein
MCKVTLGLRECDRLDGASNFVPWKLKLQILMEEVDLWEHVEKEDSRTYQSTHSWPLIGRRKPK